MKLYYYQHANFGDALNLWLWPKLISADSFDDDASSIFVGIGTLINNRLPSDAFKIVFGTGVGYGEPVPTVDQNWKIYCVRGPLSARALRIDDSMAVTDGAALVRLVDFPAETKAYDFAFMPHWQSSERWNWRLACESVGIHYIDPTADVETVLAEIRATKLVLAEAMHAAIIADAFRVPWVPVVTKKMRRGDNAHWSGALGVLEFKWHDWCESLGMEYRPTYIPRPEYHQEFVLPRIAQKFSAEKLRSSSLSRLAIKTASLGFGQAAALRNPTLTRRAGTALHQIATSTSATLSSDSAITSATEQLSERLEMFKTDLSHGKFVPCAS